MSILPKVLFSF
ncbi:unnamed protein product [Larinioides sclopetarius]|uniref:Uncharacterized protein n=1 Tax=Larinioides sclopetarius TaxID=280406 RepID=A0AAV2ABM1_9ARAC